MAALLILYLNLAAEIIYHSHNYADGSSAIT